MIVVATVAASEGFSTLCGSLALFVNFPSSLSLAPHLKRRRRRRWRRQRTKFTFFTHRRKSSGLLPRYSFALPLPFPSLHHVPPRAWQCFPSCVRFKGSKVGKSRLIIPPSPSPRAQSHARTHYFSFVPLGRVAPCHRLCLFRSAFAPMLLSPLRSRRLLAELS